MKKILNQWISRLISGTHNHFACYLPKSTGLTSRIILKLFFQNIQIPHHHIPSVRELEKQGIVITVNKYKSYFEYLFYHLRYQAEGLRYPGIGFDYRFFLWQPVFRFFKILLSAADDKIYGFKNHQSQGTQRSSRQRKSGSAGDGGHCRAKGFVSGRKKKPCAAKAGLFKKPKTL